MLEVRNINKKFSNGKGVHGISLSVQQGKPLALLGKNGAGKTTTIKLILGLISADAGEIYKGKNVTVSYLPEERGIYNDITVAISTSFPLFLYMLLRHKEQQEKAS